MGCLPPSLIWPLGSLTGPLLSGFYEQESRPFSVLEAVEFGARGGLQGVPSPCFTLFEVLLPLDAPLADPVSEGT